MNVGVRICFNFSNANQFCFFQIDLNPIKDVSRTTTLSATKSWKFNITQNDKDSPLSIYLFIKKKMDTKNVV